ncbi:MAG TPA: hypothetical protein VJI32_01375 [Candidatus Nanoarchaeia archaeon]|nr:hypothetical protein [Candidatus Nanoarchaeia archaeon]
MNRHRMARLAPTPQEGYATQYVRNPRLRDIVDTVCDAQGMLSSERSFTFEDATALMAKLLNHASFSGLAGLYWEKLDTLWQSQLKLVDTAPQRLIYDAQRIIHGAGYFEPKLVTNLSRSLGNYEHLPGVQEYQARLDDLASLVQTAQDHAEGLAQFNPPRVEGILKELQPYAAGSATVSGLYTTLTEAYVRHTQAASN